MKNKKVRDIVIAIGILLLLILISLGAFLMTRKGKEPASSNTETEGSMVIQHNDTTVQWEKEEFKDETNDKEPATTIEQLGGSETLDVVLPSETTDEKEEETAETEWQDGIW